jgi:iron complex outermembrane receptor protein
MTREFRTMALAGASLLTLTTSAFAQQAPAKAADSEANSSDDSKEIVVTGTLIRGTKAGGSQVIAVTQEKIASTGAVTTTDLIASVPQAGNFLTFAALRGTNGSQLMINRPSLRYLGNQSSSSASTLLLVDGHRLPGMAIEQSTSDLDAIAPSAIERVDIVTDGGSSTYGSDAVGGVMNFITRRTFEGVQVKGSYGHADNYNQYNASIIAGHTFDAISAYIAYDYATHDGLLGLDRDFSQGRDWVNNVPSDTACAPGNVRATVAGVTTLYALPGLTPGLGNRCDTSEFLSYYPKETKHNVMGSLLIDRGGPLTFQVKAYYVNRKTYSSGGRLLANAGVAVPSTSPYFVPLPGAPTTETFFFSLSPLYGDFTPANSTLESIGVTPSIKWDIGGGWQMNAMVNYGIGKAGYRRQVITPAPINTAAAAGLFDPVNLANPINAVPLAKALDFFNYGRAQHDMVNARAVVDGPLFELPAGSVRVAVGVEYLKEKFKGNSTISGSTSAQIAALPDRLAQRDVKSVFGELNVPVLGEGSGIHDLSITASGRFDHYSDFGDTFNPKIGVNFAPVDWFKLRGNWGKAFQAPGVSLISQVGSSNWNIVNLAQANFANPALPKGTRTSILAFAGAQNPLSPQKAKTWSVGFDINPPILEGFSAGVTYYSIDFKGVIGRPPITSPNSFYIDFPSYNVTFDKGDAAMLAYFNQLSAQGSTNTATTLASLPGGDLSSVYGIVDARQQNLARIKTTGLDFYARMRKETGFGDVFADFSGNYILSFDQQASAAGTVRSALLVDTTRLRFNTTLGTNVGNLLAQIAWNHSGGYAIIPTAANLQQNRVKSFNVFNLFFMYKVPGESEIAKDLTFTLNVDNVFDQDPPLFRGSTATAYGNANGFTLGRLVRLGVSKKF